MRIIGVELRMRYFHPRFGNRNAEIALLPCDLEIELDQSEMPSGAAGVYFQRPVMNCTLHTDKGDVTIPDFQLPFELDKTSPGLKFRSR